jgi:hypothetical protein
VTVTGILRTGAALLLAAALAACDKAPAPAPAAPAPNAAPPVPDVGKLDAVTVQAEGWGANASQAVAEAMKLAVLQVNGASIDASSVQARMGLDLVMGAESASLGAQAFVEQIRQKSGGVIRSFKVVKLDSPLLPGGRFKAEIEASIARFEPPKDLSKLKIVLAPLRLKAGNVAMGDRSLPAAEVERQLRQRIGDALVASGRFAVLDREFPAELQRELDLIVGGQAPGAEMAKLGQAASADVLWIGSVERLSYDRQVRQLRTSDRDLVSYSGGWALNHRLVNVATRQVLLSGRLAGTAPATAPTTLGTGVDGQKVFDGMSQALVDGVAAAIITQLFPVMVVARNDQDVVLSQGGQVLKPGERYAVVAMGGELKDPQTGQSLGRTEQPCCAVTIQRVTPNLAYGRLEQVAVALDSLPAGGLQLRAPLPPAAAPTMPAVPGTAAPRPARAAKSEAADDAPAAAPPAKSDGKW